MLLSTLPSCREKDQPVRKIPECQKCFRFASAGICLCQKFFSLRWPYYRRGWKRTAVTAWKRPRQQRSAPALTGRPRVEFCSDAGIGRQSWKYFVFSRRFAVLTGLFFPIKQSCGYPLFGYFIITYWVFFVKFSVFLLKLSVQINNSLRKRNFDIQLSEFF